MRRLTSLRAVPGLLVLFVLLPLVAIALDGRYLPAAAVFGGWVAAVAWVLRPARPRPAPAPAPAGAAPGWSTVADLEAWYRLPAYGTPPVLRPAVPVIPGLPQQRERTIPGTGARHPVFPIDPSTAVSACGYCGRLTVRGRTGWVHAAGDLPAGPA